MYVAMIPTKLEKAVDFYVPTSVTYSQIRALNDEVISP